MKRNDQLFLGIIHLFSWAFLGPRERGREDGEGTRDWNLSLAIPSPPSTQIFFFFSFLSLSFFFPFDWLVWKEFQYIFSSHARPLPAAAVITRILFSLFPASWRGTGRDPTRKNLADSPRRGEMISWKRAVTIATIAGTGVAWGHAGGGGLPWQPPGRPVTCVLGGRSLGRALATAAATLEGY